MLSSSTMVTLFRILGQILGRLPLSMQRLLGKALGCAMWMLLGKRRSITIHNIGKAFPAFDEQRVLSLAREHFDHLGQNIVELLGLPALADAARRDRKMVFEGFERIDEVLAAGRAAMVLTAHMGNWELMTTIAGLGYPFSALYKAQRNFFDRLLYSLRTTCGLKVYTGKDGGIRVLIRAASRGELIGVLADQGRGREFPFFGHNARFPMGAAAFHVRHGVVAFPVFGIRDESGRIVVTVHPPVEAPAGLDRREAEDLFQERYIAVLEEQVRKAPSQYYWVHDVWRDFKDGGEAAR